MMSRRTEAKPARTRNRNLIERTTTELLIVQAYQYCVYMALIIIEMQSNRLRIGEGNRY